ncbi:hypothetical protein MHK_005441 [Candidatus Magnetomorum sp. HK-1]|nr:hypothetical protein MHK_005441 [Candidatus Magnetomorum sp. HK-1]
MALESAQLFVVKMREDKNFREKVSGLADRPELAEKNELSQ